MEQAVDDGRALESCEHNLLVYNDPSTVLHFFALCAKKFFRQNNILLLASQYHTVNAIAEALRRNGINVEKHLGESTLFIVDAQSMYQGEDVYATFKLAITLISRAKKEGRKGVTWIGDVGSFFAFDKVAELIDYELFHPTKYEEGLNTVCCYHYEDFGTLDRNAQNELIQHHFKSLFVR
jgi:hypothetical protein